MKISGDTAIHVEWAMLCVAFPFVLLRLYVRYWRLRIATFADAVVVLTWLCFLVCVVCDIICWQNGLFREDLTFTDDWLAAIGNPETVTLLQKLNYGSDIVYFMQLWGVKLSVLLIYWPLIPISLKRYRLALHLVSAFVAVCFVAAVCINLFWCIPISKNWDPHRGPGTCHAFTDPITYGVAAISHILCDFIIYLLPFPLLRILHLPRKKLYGVGALFALGFLVVVAGIVRVVAIGTSVNVPAVGVFSTMEQCVGILVVCAPAVRIAIIRHGEILGLKKGPGGSGQAQQQEPGHHPATGQPGEDLGSTSSFVHRLRRGKMWLGIKIYGTNPRNDGELGPREKKMVNDTTTGTHGTMKTEASLAAKLPTAEDGPAGDWMLPIQRPEENEEMRLQAAEEGKPVISRV